MIRLAGVVTGDHIDLHADHIRRDWNERGDLGQIGFVLRDLVTPYRLPAECLGHELGNEPMVLMRVIRLWADDQIRLTRLTKADDRALRIEPGARQPVVWEGGDGHVEVRTAAQFRESGAFLPFADGARTRKDEGGDAQARIAVAQHPHRGPGTDRDVITVGAYERHVADRLEYHGVPAKTRPQGALPESYMS